MMTLFERATRENYTFESSKGQLTIGDLWHLHLTSTRGPSLQSVAVALNRQINDLGEEMFVSTASTSSGSRLLKDKLELVKRVIEVRESENAARANAAKKVAERQTLMAALERRQEADVNNLTTEELEARLKALE